MRRETTFKLKLFILAAAAPCWLWTRATAEAQADPQKVNIYTAGRAGVTQMMRELAKYPTAEEVRKHLDGAEQALNRAVHVRAAHIPDAKGDLVDKFTFSLHWESIKLMRTAHDPPTVVQMFSVHYAFDNLVSSLTGVMQVYCTSNLEAASKVDTDLKGIEAAANEWDAILAKYLAAADAERQLLWAEVFSELGLLGDVKGRNK